MDTHFHLIEACKRGDRKAQSQLYHLYAKAMYNICLRMLGSVENAEDVLQNAFIDIFISIRKHIPGNRNLIFVSNIRIADEISFQ